ncbi:N-formylglutamate amidohydrolase [Paraurantiacibacter namhicola]|uniref:N-formylglutamate amidohydrolase n=1 Tax=Paraurantiacibacter namhicola TaxID=645517 RepID=A0A1C7D9I6_9SPHN|nr:N-formylglutamate amidohydrolase [Paraurantiacibacter namhicola]ANU08150.1 N-formylglutamate amidohydrolase [Paraurantiacibacter namhicola]
MSDELFRQVGEPRPGGIVAVCDHASNVVPADIELGVDRALLDTHIAYDIGAGGVVDRLARRHDIAAHMACLSRLVVDLHREEDAAGVIPGSSDGHFIAGNIGADREARLSRFHRPYHDALGKWLDAAQPGLILSIHSFTPRLESDAGTDRPWEVGLLYNQDDSAARHAMRMFGEEGLTVGDNEPYSGKELNATMNRHAEAHGRPYLAIEIRNDLIRTEAEQARWAKLITDVAGRTLLALKSA